MAIGQSGGRGNNALKPVGKATRQEAELVAALQLKMAEGYAMAMPWSPSCATLIPVQVRI